MNKVEIEQLKGLLKKQIKNIDKLQEDKKLLNFDKSQLLKENHELKKKVSRYLDRINQAIQYIETCNPDTDLHSMFLDESYISNYGACELLKILRGENVERKINKN